MKPHTKAATERERGPEGIKCSLLPTGFTPRRDFCRGVPFCSGIAREALPCASFGRGHISSDVALLGILPFTREGGVQSGDLKGFLDLLQTDPQ